MNLICLSISDPSEAYVCLSLTDIRGMCASMLVCTDLRIMLIPVFSGHGEVYVYLTIYQ